MSDILKIAQLNANGIERSLDMLINYYTKNNIDILLLTETFLLGFAIRAGIPTPA